jgi:formate hydrogenlyase subunit 3/multisubunit Na+/H+ antiporter MnhD subunit
MNNFFPYPWFKVDALSRLAALGIGLFFILVMIYSVKFMKNRAGLVQYYAYLILTAAAAITGVLANNLILLLICWGFLGLTLYLLISMGDENSDKVAKKALIIVGGSDALMLLGIGIIYYFTQTFQMDRIQLGLDNVLLVLAYISIAIACFAKAGAMPFHSWIPDCAQSAPLPVVAFLPASLDKLLGIYLLARISLNLFVMNQAMNLFLMIIGAFTIIAAVMMALVQHNMKRLLGYHAVSQVGYMVLGIGSGNPLGIAGGIFHMLNHAVYKSCLFLDAGNVEKETGTSDLDKLGGLAKFMPLTYISCLIASLSISGVPPFNGFVSKWMVYQGLITAYQESGVKFQIFILMALIAALFGSALTLASFMKLIHATFLGQRNRESAKEHANEVAWQMWLPCIILAIICAVFGIFANQVPLKYFILPVVQGATFIGTWNAGISTLLIVIGLILGLLIFSLSNLKAKIRQDKTFIGGEAIDLEETRVTGTEFYNTVKEWGILKGIYKKAESGAFDIYEQGKTVIFSIGRFFQFLHNGVLPTYLVWMLLGMVGLFLVFFR